MGIKRRRISLDFKNINLFSDKMRTLKVILKFSYIITENSKS
jgi:hypothetical protein